MFLPQGAWLSLVTAFSSTAPLGDLISVPYAHLGKMELPKDTGGPPTHLGQPLGTLQAVVPLPGLLCAMGWGSVRHSVLCDGLQGWKSSFIAGHLSPRSGLIRPGDEASSAVC